jgi:23S rRNA pseudouridine2605 synthase
MPGVRLQKVIAQAGVASRRKAELLMVQGRVRVNGKTVTELGTTVDPETDVIVVNGRPVPKHTPLQYILLHKPQGYITTCDDEAGRPTVFDLLKRTPTRLFPVGRLDCNSEGLLLLTNDGLLANRLLHPRYRVPRTYMVKIQGLISEPELAGLRRGVVLDDGKTQPARVQVVRRGNQTSLLRMTLHEGRHRQIHRMLQRCGGYTVKKLQRVAMGPLSLAGLPRGHHRALEAFEINRLRQTCGLNRMAS